MADGKLGRCGAIIWLAVAAVGLALICVVIYLMVDGDPARAPGSAGSLTQEGASGGSGSAPTH
jgi:hypothetical protein